MCAARPQYKIYGQNVPVHAGWYIRFDKLRHPIDMGADKIQLTKIPTR
ncbi:MAG: hypothetical protein JWQ21_1935 [Herminiimonas sp.]|nr:hypothetical protein [Herminiimonas sp.]